MSNIISFSKYFDQYLYFVKKTKVNNKEYETIIKLNRKMISPYNFELVCKKFDPYDFDMEELADFLLKNEMKFRLFLPLKNIKGFYTKYFPDTESYLDHYTMDDDKNPMEKRDAKDFEYIDIFNNQTLGLWGKVKN